MALEITIRFGLVVDRRDTIELGRRTAPKACEDVVRHPILYDEQRTQIDASDGVLVVAIVVGQIPLGQQAGLVQTAAVEEIDSISGEDLPVLARQPGPAATDEKRSEKSVWGDMHGWEGKIANEWTRRKRTGNQSTLLSSPHLECCTH